MRIAVYYAADAGLWSAIVAKRTAVVDFWIRWSDARPPLTGHNGATDIRLPAVISSDLNRLTLHPDAGTRRNCARFHRPSPDRDSPETKNLGHLYIMEHRENQR